MCDVIRPCENSWSHLLLYQIEWNVGHKQIGQPASQIYKHPNTIIRGAVPFVFMGFVNSWIWIYEVPIMISRLNSGLFAAAAQIFHPLRVWGRTFLGRYPLKNPLNSDKNQTWGVYQEVLTHLSLSTTWWSGTMYISIRQDWAMDFTWISPQSVSLSS